MNDPNTPEDAIRAAVDLAGYAPSLYNAQPWSWRVGVDSVDLFMDVAHSFPITDPQNRELRIGCGAALHHLQIALAAAGWRWELERRSGIDEGRLARLRLTERCEADSQALRLVDAIPRRRTDRRPFSSRLVGEDALEGLQSSVDGEGIHLQVITHGEHRIWLAVLAERAASLQSAEPGYTEELAKVTNPHDGPADVPAEVVPHVVSPRHSDVTLRDFELLEPGTLGIAESVDEHPVWCILWTDRDAHLDWLRAGEALSRLLLTATERGLAAGVQSQPVEVAMIRAQINEHLLSSLGHAQVVVRVGYPAGAELAGSPRRNIRDHLA